MIKIHISCIVLCISLAIFAVVVDKRVYVNETLNLNKSLWYCTAELRGECVEYMKLLEESK